MVNCLDYSFICSITIYWILCALLDVEISEGKNNTVFLLKELNLVGPNISTIIIQEWKIFFFNLNNMTYNIKSLIFWRYKPGWGLLQSLFKTVSAMMSGWPTAFRCYFQIHQDVHSKSHSPGDVPVQDTPAQCRTLLIGSLYSRLSFCPSDTF